MWAVVGNGLPGWIQTNDHSLRRRGLFSLSYGEKNGGTGESRTHIVQLRYYRVEAEAGTVPKFPVFPGCQIGFHQEDHSIVLLLQENPSNRISPYDYWNWFVPDD